MNFDECIDDIISDIDNYEVNLVFEKTLKLFENFLSFMNLLSADEIGHVNIIMARIYKAMNDKDYLLVSDLLHFELRKTIRNVMESLNHGNLQ